MITAFELNAFGNILLDFGGFCFIFFCIKMLLCGVGGIGSVGWWSEDIEKVRAVPPCVQLIFCLQFGVSSAAANIINQGFYHIKMHILKWKHAFVSMSFQNTGVGEKNLRSLNMFTGLTTTIFRHFSS